MTREQWQRVKEAFGNARELGPDAQSAYVNDTCGGDPVVCNEVQRLLAAERLAGAEFLSVATAQSGPKPHEVLFPSMAGRRLGAYQVVNLLGLGGMGEVYRAFRADDQYRKEVAIKLVRGGPDSQAVFSRFRNERQILATLDHPNIARLLDGGTTEEGVPYFVMELIEGQALIEFCESHQLLLGDRLKLFIDICSAVQFAHQRLIVHRDIKPSNILVGPDGTPKLLDFGVSKILDADGQSDATLTMFRALTPAYASPEQIRGEPITTATDVYSLGVLLYELLTGRSPYSIANNTPHKISRAVCETEPERPSSAAKRSDPLAGTSAGSRGDPSSSRLGKQLKGDLDSIVLKALRKEAARRYASVEAFAADIRRHLSHLPVSARKGTVRYRSGRFVRRHVPGIAATAVVAVALATGMSLTLVEKRRADKRFNDVRALANSLLFEIHDSIRDLPGSTPARKLIVDDALRYLDSLSAEGGNDPSLMRELATAYERVGEVQGHFLQNNLGDTVGSLRSYQKAVQLRQQIGTKSRDWRDQLALAKACRLVANQLWATGDWRGAMVINAKAVSISENLRKDRPNDLNVLDELGHDYYYAAQIPGGHDSAGWNVPAIIRENYTKAAAVDAAMLQLDPGNEMIQRSYEIDLTQLGNMLRDQDRDEAGALDTFGRTLEMALKLNQRKPTTQHVRDIAVAYYQIASTYSDRIGDSKQALPYYRKALETYQSAISADPENALLKQGLAIAYANVGTQEGITGDRTGSIRDLDRGLEIMKSVVDLSPQNVQEKEKLAEFYLNRGDNFLRWHLSERAIKDDEDACTIYGELRSHASDNHVDLNISECRAKLGFAALQAGKIEPADAAFHHSLTLVEPFLAINKPEVSAFVDAADSFAGLGEVEAELGANRSLPSESRMEHWKQALDWYRKSSQIWERVPPNQRERHNGSLAEPDPGKVATNMRRCVAEMASTKKMARLH